MRFANHVNGTERAPEKGWTEAALVLVCKRPAPGVGKQRLAANLGAEGAYLLAERLLACAVEDACRWPGPVVIAPARPADYAWASRLLPGKKPQARIQPQSDGNLGQRLNALDEVLRNGGLKQLVYIGSDAPLLTEDDYAAVREGLRHHDCILKPAVDGGVVLMASREPWPLLDRLPWSTAVLGGALAACCRASGGSVMTLSQSFDVDEKKDAVRLVNALEADHRPARRALHQLVCELFRSNREERDKEDEESNAEL
jgi:glycosyltransferase A (GT-A) superfamily protein (DUF2064 family)